jgi:hypothetical protein
MTMGTGEDRHVVPVNVEVNDQGKTTRQEGKGPAREMTPSQEERHKDIVGRIMRTMSGKKGGDHQKHIEHFVNLHKREASRFTSAKAFADHVLGNAKLPEEHTAFREDLAAHALGKFKEFGGVERVKPAAFAKRNSRQLALFGRLDEREAKRVVQVGPVRIGVEYEAGEERFPGAFPLPCAYGRIEGTEAKDGDAVDCYLSAYAEGQADVPCTVIAQMDDEGDFDEPKVFVGFGADLAKQIHGVLVPGRCGGAVEVRLSQLQSQLERWSEDEEEDEEEEGEGDEEAE